MKRKIDVIALVIIIIGAVNCGIIGIFGLNVISWLFDGHVVAASRMLYVIIGISGLWCINLIRVQSQRRTAARVD